METWRRRFARILDRVIRKLRLRKRHVATTPSAPRADRYISRDQAAAQYGGTPKDIFQGDIFKAVEVLIPQPSGAWHDPETLSVMVVAHDCEWTKYLHSGRAPDYKLGIAPLRPLPTFEDENKPGLPGTIKDNKVRYLFALPHEAPLDDTYIVDLRLIQPITVAELLDKEADCLTSIGDGIKKPLQGKLLVFFTDLELVKAEAK